MCEYIWCIVVFNHSFNNIIRVSTHTTRKKAPFTTRVVLFIWRARLCWTKYNSKGALWASHVSLWLNTHINLYHLRCIYICCRWTEFVNSLSFVHVAKFKPIVLYGVYSFENTQLMRTRDERRMNRLPQPPPPPPQQQQQRRRWWRRRRRRPTSRIYWRTHAHLSVVVWCGVCAYVREISRRMETCFACWTHGKSKNTCHYRFLNRVDYSTLPSYHLDPNNE